MILSVSIRDFVLAARLDIEPVNGFTAVTGETGAGKSIILDALGCALGARAEKRYVRAGCKSASVSVEFAPSATHEVWTVLERAGVSADRGETLTLRRQIPVAGPARAFLNDQPVSATFLSEIGDTLVEIHGQHSASALMRPACHRSLLDHFAGNQDLLAACAGAWDVLQAAKAERGRLEAVDRSAQENLDWLRVSVQALDDLSPQVGEAATLAADRSFLMQAERLAESVNEASDALFKAGVESALVKAARAIKRVRMIPGFEDMQGELPRAANQAGEGLERALIELGEAGSGIEALRRVACQDTASLEQAEERLFALRAEARKHSVQVDDLPDLYWRLMRELEELQASDSALKKAGEAERAAAANWRSAANALTKAREHAAQRLEKTAMKELKPLKLGQVKFRVRIAELPSDEKGRTGADKVEFEAETNPGSGFVPLRQIASGGELARFSLALKCALAMTRGASTLIFDEVDQGVGGAVAAAIGERLDRLAKKRAQVLAITHSPQVAAKAGQQWLVEKSRPTGRKLGHTVIAALDSVARTEEIARMLSGVTITEEARAAATRLLAGP